MKHGIVAEKSFDFTKKIVNLYNKLTINSREYIMSKQVLKSGTSIGANIKEALRGQSRKDFLAKLYISIKETDETEYWLQLLTETPSIWNDFQECN